MKIENTEMFNKLSTIVIDFFFFFLNLELDV